ncbi:Short-chain dehydrogenase/reductase SDR [Apiospora sp. TS-2023a]
MSVISALHGMKSVIGSKLFVKLPVPEAGPDISEQVFIVTGANGGLGFESSLHLSRLGVGKLILGVRSLTKGEDAKRKIINLTGQSPSTVELLVLFAVRELAERSSVTGKGDSIINTPNPSFCTSNLAHESADSRAFKVFEKVMARSAEEGSRVLVHGLLVGPETNGQYLSNCQVETPRSQVTGKWGQRVQKKLVDELLERLNNIQPGIISDL